MYSQVFTSVLIRPGDNALLTNKPQVGAFSKAQLQGLAEMSAKYQGEYLLKNSQSDQL